MPVAIKREKTVAGAQEAVRTEAKVGFLLQKKPDTEEPGFDDLHRVGTVASIVRYLTAPDGTHHLVCQGERRFRVLDQVGGFPFLVARVEFLPDTGATNPDVEARALYLKQKAVEAISLLPQAPAELANSVQAIESPSMLADMIASFLDIKVADKQELLETTELKDRLERVSNLLTRRVEVLKLSRQIEEQTKEALDDRQKEILLREQMRQIRKELGEDGQGAEEIAELSEAITKAGHAARHRGARPQGAEASRAHERGERRVLDGAHLPRHAARPAVVEARRRGHRHRARARHPRRRSLRSREGQEAHRRVPRGAQAQPAGPQPDPVLRRAARASARPRSARASRARSGSSSSA